MTTSTGLVTSRPRSRKPTSRSVTRVAFSVEPSTTARAVSVASTKRRETADFDVERAAASTAVPTGSSPAR